MDSLRLSQLHAYLRELQSVQSRFLASEARQQSAADPALAVLLALEALPDAAAGVDRPYVPEAELQLNSALRGLRELVLLGHESSVRSAAFSPNGKCIVTASADRTARIWDVATGQLIGEPLKGHEDIAWGAALAPTGSASSPHLPTGRRGSGTRQRVSRSASR